MDVFLSLCLIKYTFSLLSFPESLSGCMLDVFSWLFVLLDFSYLPFSDVFPAIIVCHLLYAYLFFFSKFFSFKVIKVLLQCPEYLSASLLISCFGYKHTFHFFHLTTLMSNKSIYCLHILQGCATGATFFQAQQSAHDRCLIILMQDPVPLLMLLTI